MIPLISYLTTLLSLQSSQSNMNNMNKMNNMNMSLRKRLLSDFNTKSYGPFLLSSSPTIAEVLSNVGYSHIVVDMEHSPLDVSSTLSMLRSIDSSRNTNFENMNKTTTPIVRLPSHHDIANTKRILDILKPPAGIMFPMIENAQQAQLAISSITYPPNGIRGCAHPFVRASQYNHNLDYFDISCREDILTIMQIESKDAIENIREIGMVDGVDCLFLGPFDISCSVGQMGKFDKGGQVWQLLRKAERLVRETSDMKKEKAHSKQQHHGLILGGFQLPGRNLDDMFSNDVGYQFVSGSVDIGMIQSAAKADLLKANKAISKIQ